MELCLGEPAMCTDRLAKRIFWGVQHAVNIEENFVVSMGVAHMHIGTCSLVLLNYLTCLPCSQPVLLLSLHIHLL
eukprot:7484408-Karenia_brevis.AAC.1